MNKFKCTTDGCQHSSEKAGYCPDHGSALVENKAVDKAGLEGLLKEIGEAVSQGVKNELKELGFDALPSKVKVAMPKTGSQKLEYAKSILGAEDTKMYEALTGEEQVKFLKTAKVGLFFKHLVAFASTKDPEHLAHVKALSEGDNASGGYLVPTEFRAELIKDLKDQPFLRRWVTVIPMSSDSLEIPTLASDVKVSWGSENTAISTTTARFGTLTFAPKRLNTMMYTSRELVADSAIAVVPLIQQLFVEAIGREEDRVIINGSGTGQPTGILNTPPSGINNANDDSTLAPNIVKLPFRLPKAYRAKARWAINSLAREAIAALRDQDLRFLFTAGIEGQNPDKLVGYPVEEQNDLPVDTLLFGDFSKYYLADRQQISVETTTEGAGTFEKHQVAIKIVERIDGKPALLNAFRVITNAGID